MTVTLTGALSAGFLLPDSAPLPKAEGTTDTTSTTPAEPTALAWAAARSDVALQERASRSLSRQALADQQRTAAEARRKAEQARKAAAEHRRAVKAAAAKKAAARRSAAAKARAEARAERARQAKRAEARAASRSKARTSSRKVSSASYRGIPARVANLNWSALARCESGGNPRAVNPSGKYLGLYQFDRQTWRSVGGSGSPASASRAEQTYRAQKLYVERGGSSPWPVCGRRL